jgi:hypothetical protein
MEDKKVWDSVAQLEDSECIRRFLCEVATETFKAPDFEALVRNIITNDQVSIL